MDACVGSTQCQNVPDDSLCDDGNPCTNDVCVPGAGCRNKPVQDAVDCDDGDPCTLGDECQFGTCAGAALTCPGGAACLAGKCLPCVEGSSFCSGNLLVLCQDAAFDVTDCSTSGAACVLAVQTAASCAGGSPEPEVDAGGHPDAAGSETSAVDAAAGSDAALPQPDADPSSDGSASGGCSLSHLEGADRRMAASQRAQVVLFLLLGVACFTLLVRRTRG
jgi:hypothetical protein